MSFRSKLADHGKAYACLLVLLGHVILGMENAGVSVLPSVTLFREVIWTVHIPVFLYFNGYVFALGGFSRGKGGKLPFLKKKLFTLGIPYVFFSFLYIAINALSGSANHQNNFSDFFLIWKTPVAQYWYLYALFFLFAFWVLWEGLLPPFAIALASVGVGYLASFLSLPLGPFEAVFSSALPFALGVLFPLKHLEKIPRWGKLCTVLLHALAAAILVRKGLLSRLGIKEGMWILGIVASICLVSLLGEIPALSRFLSFVGRHSFPIYLTHTIFTAGIRVVLMRLGITHAIPHLILGLLCGFFFPWLLSLWSERFAPLHFLFYPKRKKKTATV